MLNAYQLHDITVKTQKIKGLKSNEYKKKGKYPVIDQGSEFIAGYSDSEEALYRDSLPVVVFGDHTLNLKYIDFPFCVGADGTQILRPNERIVSAKFLYYSIRNLNIKSRGYSRHFKFLKEAKYLIPPLPEQSNIIKILDKAESIKQKRKKCIDLLDTYIYSVFWNMFGDMYTNPKAWQIKTLAEITKKITDGTHQPPKFAEEGIPFIFISNIINNEIDLNTKKFISESTYKELTKSTPIEIGDILYTTVGSYGNPALVKTHDRFCFQRHIAHIKPNPEITNVYFLYTMLKTPFVRRQADEKVRGVAQKTLNLVDLKGFKVFLPPIDNQNKFAEIVKRTDTLKKKMLRQSVELENQFQALMQKSFQLN